MKRPDGRIGVRHFVAGVFGKFRARFVAEFSEQSRSHSVGDKTSRIQAVELIEQWAIALEYAWHIRVIRERLDSIFQLLDRMPSGVINAIKDGRDTGLQIWDRARMSKATKPNCVDSVVELGSGSSTDGNNFKFVPGRGVDTALRTYCSVAIQIIAEAPRER